MSERKGESGPGRKENAKIKQLTIDQDKASGVQEKKGHVKGTNAG